MNSPLPPEDPDAKSTAELILEHAASLFAQKGFTATSMREISAAADVTKPTLYYHFENKEGLIRAIVNLTTKWLIEALQPASELNIREGLIFVAHRMLISIKTHPTLFMVMCRLQYQTPNELVCDIERQRKVGHDTMVALFQKAMDLGQLRVTSPELLAGLFMGGLVTIADGLTRGEVEQGPPESEAAIATLIVDLFLNGALPIEDQT